MTTRMDIIIIIIIIIIIVIIIMTITLIVIILIIIIIIIIMTIIISKPRHFCTSAQAQHRKVYQILDNCLIPEGHDAS